MTSAHADSRLGAVQEAGFAEASEATKISVFLGSLKVMQRPWSPYPLPAVARILPLDTLQLLHVTRTGRTAAGVFLKPAMV